eukprot:7937259-Pyramimonas_sp.AAC.1
MRPCVALSLCVRVSLWRLSGESLSQERSRRSDLWQQFCTCPQRAQALTLGMLHPRFSRMSWSALARRGPFNSGAWGWLRASRC